jgi:hypothetical protein
VGIEICAQVRLKAVYVSKYWIEWICRDTIEMEESNRLAVFVYDCLQPTLEPLIYEVLQSAGTSISLAASSSP